MMGSLIPTHTKKKRVKKVKEIRITREGNQLKQKLSKQILLVNVEMLHLFHPQ